ncbi:MAG TPA: GNAT family N-acetyltransferase, partial [Candidatus Kryptonia bacterium]|nr:GNAT family N-acetyltransferase [Candidatus Kryptonia bacterium]
HGTQPVEGALAGDWCVAPQWQRQGIAGLRSDVRHSHVWQDQLPALSWPNEKSRGSGIKRGKSAQILGPVPRAVLLLKTKEVLAGRGWPALLSSAGGVVCDTAVDLWRKAVLRDRTDLAVEAVHRFDSGFDGVTQRCMAWHGFWSPHDADFLNWRYLERPAGQYLAFALADRGQLAGYSVLKIEPDSAWLMEFAVPTSPRRLASKLLLHAIATARAAGCASMRFTASPQWRHWPFLRLAGFLPARSEIYLWPGGPDEANELGVWQWTPGDMDEL